VIGGIRTFDLDGGSPERSRKQFCDQRACLSHKEVNQLLNIDMETWTMLRHY
jgi:hypothetical protein